jgi:hypothetical protein
VITQNRNLYCILCELNLQRIVLLSVCVVTVDRRLSKEISSMREGHREEEAAARKKKIKAEGETVFLGSISNVPSVTVTSVTVT